MPCYYPLTAYRSVTPNQKSGKKGITFSPDARSALDGVVHLPCGRCIGCRLERARQWAVRMMHEMQEHEFSWFVTLTYRPECLPPGGSLRKVDFQLFMKRLRKWYGRPVRYFHCGEYGERLSRPHYHAVLFGLELKDLKLLREENGNALFTSEILEKLWGNGYCTVGQVTFESCAYVAGYVTKKVTGPKAVEHYGGKEPEYATMSRRKGIGYRWIERFGGEVLENDSVIVKGREAKPPRYYDKVLEQMSPEEMEKVYQARMESAWERFGENYGDRLVVREKVKRGQISLKRRSFEE